METILMSAKTDTVDMLVEMIFGDMKMSKIQEIQNMSEELKRKFIIDRINRICEEIQN